MSDSLAPLHLPTSVQVSEQVTIPIVIRKTVRKPVWIYPNGKHAVEMAHFQAKVAKLKKQLSGMGSSLAKSDEALESSRKQLQAAQTALKVECKKTNELDDLLRAAYRRLEVNPCH